MQTRNFPVDVFNKNLTFFMEGMNSLLTSETAGILYNKLANIRTLKNPKDVLATFTGGGLYAAHGEWQEAKMFEPGNGWTIPFNPTIYKSSFRVAGTTTEFPEVPPMIQNYLKLLGAYGIETVDQIFMNMFNYGFNAAYATYDGQPLFSTAHPLRNASGTFANRPAVGSALSETSLAEALTYFMSIPNDDGVAFSMTPVALIVHPTRRLLADQILLSASAFGQPNSGIRNLVTAYSSLQVFSSPKLTNPNAWFVAAGKSEIMGMGHGLDLWFTQQGLPSIDIVQQSDPTATKYIGAYRVAPTVTKVRGIYGNPGV